MKTFTYNKTASKTVIQFVEATQQAGAKVLSLYNSGMRKEHCISPKSKGSLADHNSWLQLKADILSTQPEALQAKAKMPNKSMAAKGTAKGDKQREDKESANSAVAKYVTDLGAKLAGLEANGGKLLPNGKVKRAPQVAKAKSVTDIRTAHTKLADACSDVTDHPNIVEYTARLAHAFEAIQGGVK
jgi:hypothetical protein